MASSSDAQTEEMLKADLESFTVQGLELEAAPTPILEAGAGDQADEIEEQPQELTEAERLELVADQAGLMSLDEFRELVTFGLALPEAWVPDLKGLAIQDHETAAALEAMAATRRLIIRAESLHWVLRKREGTFGDAIAAGAFFLMKARIIAAYLQARREREEAKPVRKAGPDRKGPVALEDDADGIELGKG